MAGLAQARSLLRITSDPDLGRASQSTTPFLLGEAADRDEARRLSTVIVKTAPLRAALNSGSGILAGLAGRRADRDARRRLNLMVNGWLAQTLNCRLLGQLSVLAGGAFGFRDQLQDAAALIYHDPQLARQQLLLHAAHQFVEGDVLHWWHPPGGRGIAAGAAMICSGCSYLAAFYARVTGEWSCSGEPVPFLQARPLKQVKTKRS